MSGERTEHISLGIVKRVQTATTPEGNELRVEFWNRGLLVVRAAFGEPLSIDLTPASLAQLVPPSYYREDPRLYDAAREACHACGLPWTDPRTGTTYPPPPLTDAVVDAFLAAEPPADPDRVARIRERFEASDPSLRAGLEHLEAKYSAEATTWRESADGTGPVEYLRRARIRADLMGQFVADVADLLRAQPPDRHAEQYEAVLRKVQQEIHVGTASHECSEWRRGLLCEVCGAWLGEREP